MASSKKPFDLGWLRRDFLLASAAISCSLAASVAHVGFFLPEHGDPAPELARRLTRIAAVVEQKRKELEIPGAALAIVKNDKPVLHQGFGVSDLSRREPVTPQTLFAIGSDTKAFTA